MKKKMLLLALILIIFLNSASCVRTEKSENLSAKVIEVESDDPSEAGLVEGALTEIGDYFGQTFPGENAERFAKEIITNQFEAQNCLSISEKRKEIVYGIYDTEEGLNKVFSSKYVNGEWSEPERFYPFDIDAVGIDAPFFSPDSKRLYFLAKHPVDAGDKELERIYYVEEYGDEWSKPIALPDFFDEYEVHMQFSVESDYSIYFKSKHEMGLGLSDIWYSKYENNEYQQPQNLPETINTEANEMSPFVSPDGSYLIFSRNRISYGHGGADLFISVKDSIGMWTEAVNLDDRVNSYSHETCPIVSPDGNYLFFNSNRLGKFEIYWVKADVISE